MMSFALPTGTACAAAPVMQAVKRVEGDRERDISTFYQIQALMLSLAHCHQQLTDC